ncbi:MAG TPA: DNA polymerase III subunit delta' [Myxococcales bacterium]|nr:DNA polymerase III subunit delta' [Myxococcales bacterium]
MPIEPWSEIVGQERAVRLLRRALGRGQPHHAYLLAGPPGVGKELLARLFAQAANCEVEDVSARPCGECPACKGIARGSYPDVQWVMPLAELIARGKVSRADFEGAASREIRVDEVRELSRRLSFAPVRGRRKIAILTPADALNERAQNTLLKTLEEPPPSTSFVLVTAQPDQLLATVRSRCARVQLMPLSDELIAARLVQAGVAAGEARERAHRAGGSLGRALGMSGDELSRAREMLSGVEAALADSDERAALDLSEALGERDAAAQTAQVVLQATRDELVALARAKEPPPVALPPTVLLAQHALCTEVIAALEQNGNPRLQLERLLLGLRNLRSGQRKEAAGG